MDKDWVKQLPWQLWLGFELYQGPTNQRSAILLASISTSRGWSWVVSVSKIVHILVSVSTTRSFPVSNPRLTYESLSLGLESWNWLSRYSLLTCLTRFLCFTCLLYSKSFKWSISLICFNTYFISLTGFICFTCIINPASHYSIILAE